jgi:hypothetical protein
VETDKKIKIQNLENFKVAGKLMLKTMPAEKNKTENARHPSYVLK